MGYLTPVSGAMGAFVFFFMMVNVETLPIDFIYS